MEKEPSKQQHLHCRAAVSDEGSVAMGGLALGMAVQFLKACGLSVFLASMNGWNYGCFKE